MFGCFQRVKKQNEGPSRGLVTAGVPHDKKNTPVIDGAQIDATERALGRSGSLVKCVIIASSMQI